MPLSRTPDQQAWDEFVGLECFGCGQKKPTKNAFCRKCYFSLPDNLRRGLYKRFGSGFEDVYWEARDLLTQEARARK